LKLFNKLKCTPGPNANTVDPSWKATAGYSDAQAQYDDPNTQIVSCDASGGKYVLDKAVFDGKDIASVATGPKQNTGQWVVDLTLDARARTAFGTLTTNQYNTYFSGSQTGNEDDAVLDQTAVVLDGDVQSAPETQGALTTGQFEINGGGSTGFSRTC
jgi:preprotein translocase subunit SecD